jgi:hypothetical protein
MCRLAELVAEPGVVGVLGKPGDEPRPGAEKRFVDDLDSALALTVAALLLEAGQEAGVAESGQNIRRDLGGRDQLSWPIRCPQRFVAAEDR